MIAFVWAIQLLYLSASVLGNPLFPTLLTKRASFDLNKTPSPEHSNEIKDVEDNVNHFILALPASTLEEKSGLLITTKSGRKKVYSDKNAKSTHHFHSLIWITPSYSIPLIETQEKGSIIDERR